jgi:DNA mismatch repair protein MutL
VAVLRFDLPGELLDVNVHPAKLEVRINDPQLYSNLTHMIREAISGGQAMPDFSSYGQIAGDAAVAQETNRPSLQTFNEIIPQWFKEEPVLAEPAAKQAPFWATGPEDRPASRLQGFQALEHLEPLPSSKDSGVGPAAHTAVLRAFAGTALNPEDFIFDESTPFQVIGQLHHTFILAETGAGLMMIDQHVAHERVLYEKLLAEHQDALIPAQMLLSPLPLHLTDAEEDALVRNIMVLSDLGMIVERFGPRDYVLRSAPAGQSELSEAFFKDLLEQLAERPGAMRPEDVRQSLLIMMSCKGAVKANQPLTMKEMENLLMQLQQTRHPMTCPHGRPIIYMLPYHRLLRAFGRSS